MKIAIRGLSDVLEIIKTIFECHDSQTYFYHFLFSTVLTLKMH